MRYPAAIEPGDETRAWGVVVPDLPGCFSAGDTLDEAISNAEEAVRLWVDQALDDGLDIPRPSTLDQLRARADFTGWVLALIDLDPAALDDTIERVNISLPRRILQRIDAQAKEAGETRSGYIARLAIRG